MKTEQIQARLATLGIKVGQGDWNDWMEGGKNYTAFDEAVKKFMGRMPYDYYTKLARLPQALDYALGLGPATDSGVNVAFHNPQRLNAEGELLNKGFIVCRHCGYVWDEGNGPIHDC